MPPIGTVSASTSATIARVFVRGASGAPFGVVP